MKSTSKQLDEAKAQLGAAKAMVSTRGGCGRVTLVVVGHCWAHTSAVQGKP